MSKKDEYNYFLFITRRSGVFQNGEKYTNKEFAECLPFDKSGNPVEYGNLLVKEKHWDSFECYEMLVGKKII